MAKARGKDRPPQPGPLHLRDCIRRALSAFHGSPYGEARLEIALVEQVERALRCELPDEVLACFANGDDTLPEWGFTLDLVADHTAWARQLGCRSDWIAVGQDPDGATLYCIERRGDRRRAVGLIKVETEASGETQRCDLGDWLTEQAGLDPGPRHQDASVQLVFWPEAEPEPRVWRLV